MLTDLVRQQPVDQADLGGRVVGRLGEVLGQRRLVDEQRDHRTQFVGQRGEPGRPEIARHVVELGDQHAERLATGGTQAGRRGGLDDRVRRRHLVELVEEPVDRRGLRSGVGDVGTHEFVGLLDRLVAEPLTQLSDELLAHELNLLRALGLDAFGVDASLLGQLRFDALGVLPGLVGDLRRLGLGVLECLGVHRVGVGEFLRRLGALGQCGAHRVLLLLHHPLHEWYDPLDDDGDDDREADQVSDEDAHLAVPS